MPTYDYECQVCGHTFELFQGINDRLKRKCPACGKPSLQRLIGPGAGFLFKGKGFYITDYRSESYRSGEKSAKDAREGTSAADKGASVGKGSGGDKSGSADKGSGADTSGGAGKSSSDDKSGSDRGTGADKGGKSGTHSPRDKAPGAKPKRGKSASRG